MTDVVSYNVTSITTKNRQTLYLDGEDAAYLKDKRVLIVDDVVSTGESLIALENLVSKAGGKIAGRLTVLAEGDAQYREDLIYLERLPLFHADGSILE